MACSKCGGKRKQTTIHFTVYEIEGSGEPTVKIGVSSAILLRGQFGEKALRTGNVFEVSEADATNLLSQEAPIWKIS